MPGDSDHIYIRQLAASKGGGGGGVVFLFLFLAKGQRGRWGGIGYGGAQEALLAHRQRRQALNRPLSLGIPCSAPYLLSIPHTSFELAPAAGSTVSASTGLGRQMALYLDELGCRHPLTQPQRPKLQLRPALILFVVAEALSVHPLPGTSINLSFAAVLLL